MIDQVTVMLLILLVGFAFVSVLAWRAVSKYPRRETRTLYLFSAVCMTGGTIAIALAIKLM